MVDVIKTFPISEIDDQKVFAKWSAKLKNINSKNLHPLILEYDEIIKEREHRKKYAYIDKLPFDMQHEEREKAKFKTELNVEKSILDVRVSSSQRRTAYTIVNQIIKGIEKLGGNGKVGHSNEDLFEIKLNGICWRIKVVESTSREGNYSDNFSSQRKMQPVYTRKYTGILTITIQNIQTDQVKVFTNEKTDFSKQLVDIFSVLREEYIPIYRQIKSDEEKQKVEYGLELQRVETEQLATQAKQLEIEISQKREQLENEVLRHIEKFENIIEVEEYLNKLLQKFPENSSDYQVIQDYYKTVQKIYNLDNLLIDIKIWTDNYTSKK